MSCTFKKLTKNWRKYRWQRISLNIKIDFSEDSKQIEKLKVEVRRLQAETGSNSSTPTQSPRTPRGPSDADGQPDQSQRLESVEEDNQL